MPKSSILAIVESPGHTSHALPSLCISKLKRQFFAGDLPKNGTICQIDATTFPDSSDFTNRLATMSEDDRRLFKAAQELSRALSSM